MLSFEGKFGLTVVKSDFRPAFFHMTGFAAVFLYKFVNLTLVRVGMADQAFERIELKMVAFCHRRPIYGDMTGDAGHGEVRSLERIFGRIMLRQEEISRGKPLDGMAFLAGSSGNTMGKFTIMVIGMAIKTGRKLESLGLSRLMTFFTGDILMFPFKGIPCPAMIEICGTYLPPAIGSMTISADRTQPSFMHVLMAIGAL